MLSAARIMGANADTFFKLEAAAQPSLLHQYELAAAAEAAAVLDVTNYDTAARWALPHHGAVAPPHHSSTGCGLRDRAFMFTSAAAAPGPTRARSLHTSSAAHSAAALGAATEGVASEGEATEGEAQLRVLNVIDGYEAEAAAGGALSLIDATTGRPRGSVSASGASMPPRSRLAPKKP